MPSTSQPRLTGLTSLLPLPALVCAALLAALSGGCGLLAVWAMVRMVDEPSMTWPTVAVGAWIASALLSVGASWLAHASEGVFEARLRRKIAGHLLRLPAHRLATYSTDRLRRLISDDVTALHHMIAHLPSEVATLAIIPASAAILLLALAGPPALLALLPGALAACVYLLIVPRLSARHGAQRAAVMEEITTAVDEYARGIAIFRLAGAGSGALADYAGATARFTAGMTAWVRKVATPAAIAVGLLQAAASYAIAFTVAGTSDLPRLAAIVLLSLALVTPALKLGHGLDYVAAGRAAAHRIASLLAEPSLPSGAESPRGPLDVAIDDLSVTMGEHEVLDGLSMTARAGEVTAITGDSGAGKTTMLHVIAGLQEPTRGQINLGSTPIESLDEDSRTDAIALIPQGIDVLHADIRENLTLGRAHDDHALREALDRAGLPLSLDTDAAILSGGERQRLGLARAFLGPARVILLDEPTSALDDKTADRIWRELLRLARQESATIIVVTHDIDLANRADRHYRLAAGGIR